MDITQISSIIGVILFSVIAVMTLLVACGLPLGEFTMGGKYKELPAGFKMMAAFSFIIQLYALAIILQMGGLISFWFSFRITKYICIFFAVYLSINTVMNYLSSSKKEKYLMTPPSFIAAISFWVTAFTSSINQ
jgi:hypothetical protein